jgi:hypothetical protein
MSAACTQTSEAVAVALVFAAIFRYGWRLHRPEGVSRRGLLSLAAGISVAYVFVHVLPWLSHGTEIQMESAGAFPLLFPEYSVYLWTMAGFLIFFGLERLSAQARERAAEGGEGSAAEPGYEFWLNVGGFGAYTWLLTYFVACGRIAGWLGIGVYTVAMALHLLPVTVSLTHDYGRHYQRAGSWLLAAAGLAGALCGGGVGLPKPLVVILVAVVMGGVIINSMVAELPSEKQGKVLPFVGGALCYTAIMLCLSHFEAGG